MEKRQSILIKASLALLAILLLNNCILANANMTPADTTADGGSKAAASNEGQLWVKTKSYDLNGQMVGHDIVYFNNNLQVDQVHTKLFSKNVDLVRQVIYDANGQPVLSTHAVPVPSASNEEFTYKKDFIVAEGESGTYDYSDFDLPRKRVPTLGDVNMPKPISGNCLLGAYYSDQNTAEPFVAASKFPYTRVEYNKTQGGVPRKSALAGDSLKMGDGHEAQTYSMFASNFLQLRYPDKFQEHEKFVKRISKDRNGVEKVSFYNSQGNLVAHGLSGTENGQIIEEILVTTSIKNNTAANYVDIHLPIGYQNNLSLSFIGGSTDYYRIRDLSTDLYLEYESGSGSGTKETGYSTDYYENSPLNIGPGFYRLYYYAPNTVEWGQMDISYMCNYHSLAVNTYDAVGRLKRKIAPNQTETKYTYNAYGQLTEKWNTDENAVKYYYTEDGLPKATQNQIDLDNDEVNSRHRHSTAIYYDAAGRVKHTAKAQEYNIYGIPGGYQEPLFNVATNTYEDIVNTVYDEADPSIFELSDGNLQQYVPLGRVSKTYNGQCTTWYSYDKFGRQDWVAKYSPELGLKSMHYTYSAGGSLQTVVYQKFNAQEYFAHKFEYDQDLRLKKLYTGLAAQDPFAAEGTQPPLQVYNWKLQAEYEYYLHGPLKNVKIADGLQQVDYIYTINGWLKSINAPNFSQSWNSDLFGITYDYFAGDYQRAGTKINYGMAKENLFNGNIKSARWKTRLSISEISSGAYVYSYDEGNCLTSAVYGTYQHNSQQNNTTSNMVEQTYNGEYASNFTPMQSTYSTSYSYDNIGNLLTLKRYANNSPAKGALQKDDYVYEYNTDPFNNTPSNRLKKVVDATSLNPIYTFTYNAIGQTVAEKKDGKEYYYEYNSYGLTKAVYADSRLQTPIAKYEYDENMQRRKKTVYSRGLASTEVYYVRMGSQIVATYYKDLKNETPVVLEEIPLYAAGRIGAYKPEANHYLYEISDHLGNVRTVFGDQDANGVPELESYADYYPFGKPMPGKQLNPTLYKHGYQGQFAEKDEETQTDFFQLRSWDAQLARWINPDPYKQYFSPYLGMGNNPINLVDPDGGQTLGPDGIMTFDELLVIATRIYKPNIKLKDIPGWTPPDNGCEALLSSTDHYPDLLSAKGEDPMANPQPLYKFEETPYYAPTQEEIYESDYIAGRKYQRRVGLARSKNKMNLVNMHMTQNTNSISNSKEGMTVENSNDAGNTGGIVYYGLQFSDPIEGSGHSFVYFPDEDVAYEVNHPFNGLVNGVKTWVKFNSIYTKAFPYKHENPFNENSSFWNFGIDDQGNPTGQERYNVVLSAIWVPDIEAARNYYEGINNRGTWGYTLPFSNCKHFVMKGLEAGGVKINILSDNPFPKEWYYPFSPNVKTNPNFNK